MILSLTSPLPLQKTFPDSTFRLFVKGHYIFSSYPVLSHSIPQIVLSPPSFLPMEIKPMCLVRKGKVANLETPPHTQENRFYRHEASVRVSLSLVD